MVLIVVLDVIRTEYLCVFLFFWEIIFTEIVDAIWKISVLLILIVVYKFLSVRCVGCQLRLLHFVQLHGPPTILEILKGWLYCQFSTVIRWVHQIYFYIGPKDFMNLCAMYGG